MSKTLGFFGWPLGNCHNYANRSKSYLKTGGYKHKIVPFLSFLLPSCSVKHNVYKLLKKINF